MTKILESIAEEAKAARKLAGVSTEILESRAQEQDPAALFVLACRCLYQAPPDDLDAPKRGLSLLNQADGSGSRLAALLLLLRGNTPQNG